MNVVEVRRSSAPTGVAVVVVDGSGDNSIIVVPGPNHLVEAEQFTNVPIAAGDIVVSQCEIPHDAIQHL